MSSNVNWDDVVYCSKGKLSITPDRQLQMSAAYQADFVLFAHDLIKFAEEAQRRNNALVPLDQYTNTFSKATTVNAYYDDELKQNLDILQLSVQVAAKEENNIVKGL